MMGFYTLVFLFANVEWAQAQDAAEDIPILRPDAGQEELSTDTFRHPLESLVGPHYEHHWGFLPYFFVPEGGTKCFKEFIPTDINVAIPFYAPIENDYPCSVNILDANGATVTHKVVTKEKPVGLLHYKSLWSQQYKICAICGRSSWMGTTQTKFSLKIELLTEMNDQLALLDGATGVIAKPSKYTTSYQVINNYLREAHNELGVIIELEFQELAKQLGDYSSVEAMKWKIMLMSFVTLACTGMTMFFVVSYLRQFFRREKVI